MPAETALLSKSMPVLKVGSTDAQTGNAVSTLINFLVYYGFGVEGISGQIAPGKAIYGAKVKAAVMHFQEMLGLPVDGVVGPQTWEMIDLVKNTPTEQHTVVKEAGAPSPTVPSESEPQLPVQTKRQATWTDSPWFWPVAIGGVFITASIVVTLLNRRAKSDT